MLELKTALGSIRPATDDDIGSHEAENLEISPKFLRGPHLPVLRFKSILAPRSGVDFSNLFAADGFSWITHSVSYS